LALAPPLAFDWPVTDSQSQSKNFDDYKNEAKGKLFFTVLRKGRLKQGFTD